MIVRRLCVTPAVGSLMQWLFASRNRTAERTNPKPVTSTALPFTPRPGASSNETADRRRSSGQTQQLLQGPLKHIKAAALAAALLPLASVAATPAQAQTACASGGVCGTVFEDTNNNGMRDGAETGLEGVKLFVCQL